MIREKLMYETDKGTLIDERSQAEYMDRMEIIEQWLFTRCKPDDGKINFVEIQKSLESHIDELYLLLNSSTDTKEYTNEQNQATAPNYIMSSNKEPNEAM